MNQPIRISYLFVLGLLVLVAVMHMTVPLIAVLFAFFALNRLSFGQRWVGVILFLVMMVGVASGLYFVAKQAVVALPTIANESIPRIIDYAEGLGLELPFTDTKSLRTLLLTNVQTQFAQVGGYVRVFAVEAVSIVIGVVVAISLFMTRKLDLGSHPGAEEGNLYTATGQA